LIRASTINARHAVRAAQGKVAAWAKLHALGQAGEGVGGHGDIFRGEAVRAIPRHTHEPFPRRAARRPVREEGGEHIISHFDGADAIADAHDFPGAVGHRNAAVGCLDHPGDDGEVVKIQ
jgi:hypothetical protein